MNPYTIRESIPLAPFYKWVHIFVFILCFVKKARRRKIG
jgi:hypothetical protein